MTDIGILIKGALLHDIGKVCYRALGRRINHSSLGYQFLLEVAKDSEYIKPILDCIQYHHNDNLKGAKLDSKNLAYIVYEADNIASGMERRKNEGEIKGFDPKLNLDSIFSVFNGEHNSEIKNKYDLLYNDLNRGFNYPVEDAKIATKDTYMALYNKMKSLFLQDFNQLEKISINQLLQIIEDCFVYVPSSTDREQVCDISLYMHSKLTAAIASCMKLYFEEKQIEDYKAYCYNSTKKKDFRNENTFLLVSGDLSGIQKFIYTIPSKGALKTLRGRSLYVELLVENFIDELLEDLNLTRANVIYSGGGHFYILTQNTVRAKRSIERLQTDFNRWLLDNMGIHLYLATGIAECSANDLMDSKAQGNIFAIVNSEIKFDKTTRYSKDLESFAKLFEVDINAKKKQECSICHNLSEQLYAYTGEEKIACDNCLSLYKLGAKALEENMVFLISENKGTDAIKLFGKTAEQYLYVMPEDQISDKYIRIYSKNKRLNNIDNNIRLYSADYKAVTDDNNVMTFDELAKSSGGNSQGINRLGVLRIDVDDLGVAFSSGFLKEQGTSKDGVEKYATLSRYADLSKAIAMFFKVAVNKLCAGDLSGLSSVEEKAYNIFARAKKPNRKVHIVYSGGDDLFIVGAWDDVLELAVDIRYAFKQFTNDKLSFSAGMAMFSSTYPISKMAEITGLLQEQSKSVKGKDSIALFGLDTHVDENLELVCKHIYKWDEFVKVVCQEKLNFLLSHLSFDGNSKHKINVGKSLIYRLLDLLDLSKADDLNIARFAYVLGRMQPKNNNNNDPLQMKKYQEFVSRIYRWINNDKDKQQLITALTLLVYFIREKKE